MRARGVSCRPAREEEGREVVPRRLVTARAIAVRPRGGRARRDAGVRRWPSGRQVARPEELGGGSMLPRHLLSPLVAQCRLLKKGTAKTRTAILVGVGVSERALGDDDNNATIKSKRTQLRSYYRI